MEDPSEPFTFALSDYNTVCPYTSCALTLDSTSLASVSADITFSATDLNNPVLTIDSDDLTLVGATNDPFKDYAASLSCSDATPTE